MNWIDYSNSEVAFFHPVCEKALNKALQSSGLDKEYRVVHHFETGTIQPDFVIENRKKKTILLVVEVKRTPSAVHSTRYQYQALSYVENIGSQMETPYYVLTNLEFSYLFKRSTASGRSKPFQQILKPGLLEVGSFSQSENGDIFSDKLAKIFCDIIGKIKSNFSEYLLSLSDLVECITNDLTSPKDWKTDIAAISYQYIRGALENSNKLSLKDISFYCGKTELFCSEAAKIDFSPIFAFNCDEYSEDCHVSSALLDEAYTYGKESIEGDALASLIHSSVCFGREHLGLVPTDPEIASMASALAKITFGEEKLTGFICDPAAGSGSLLSSSISVFNPQPCQLFANDREKHLLELLSLRLGLKFPGIICPSNSPRVICEDIRNLEKSDFENVQIALLNPPFVSGIYSTKEKEEFRLSFIKHFGREPTCSIGQIGLEAPFIEFVFHLLPSDCVFVSFLPRQYLVSDGAEAVAFRHFLVEEFNLSAILNYPGDTLFSNVIKDTCLIVSDKREKSEKVKIISSHKPIQDIDIDSFENGLKNCAFKGSVFIPISDGIEAKEEQLSSLLKTCDGGWKSMNSIDTEILDFYMETQGSCPKLVPFVDSGFAVVRGHGGTSGASDLLFQKENSPLLSRTPQLFSSFRNGLRNADTVSSIVLGKGDTKFLNYKDYKREQVDAIIEAYLSIPLRQGKQAKHEKTPQDLLEILRSEAAYETRAFAIAIPRDLRITGKAYIVDKDIFISTNFFIIPSLSERDAFLLGSWMNTIFYQLSCELHSKNQEGTRKMEIVNFNDTLIPRVESITDHDFKNIQQACHDSSILNLQKPILRPIDIVWSDILFKSNAAEVLRNTKAYLQMAAVRRNNRQ